MEIGFSGTGFDAVFDAFVAAFRLLDEDDDTELRSRFLPAFSIGPDGLGVVTVVILVGAIVTMG